MPPPSRPEEVGQTNNDNGDTQQVRIGVADSLADFLPVQFPAKPPENGQRQQQSVPNSTYFRVTDFRISKLLDSSGNQTQDIGPREGYYSS